jgi:hypothetical protein
MENRLSSVLRPKFSINLNLDSGDLSLIPLDAPSNSNMWVLEFLGIPDTYRIRHRTRTDHYLHVQEEALKCEPIGHGANSSYWVLEAQNTHNTFQLRNFWRTNWYIYQDGDDVAAGPVDQTSLTTHWHLEDTSDNRFLVPIHLDALWLDTEQGLVSPFVDFSRLPFFDGSQDVNPNIPHISEVVLNPSLDSPQFFLKTGLHLHWSLPDALHQGFHESGSENSEMRFFNAPDRWLVTRLSQGETKQWIVESNYLHPPGDIDGYKSIAYPFKDDSSNQPYRHLGRTIPFSEWSEADSDGTNLNYLHDLTAIGYGEPTFAAFYPHCHSVFGFYDEDTVNKSIDDFLGVRYEVVGWHSRLTADILHDPLIDQKADQLRAGHKATLVTSPYKFETVKNELGWVVENSNNLAFPEQTSYFARLTILPINEEDEVEPSNPDLKIFIANTPTEALAAHLGLEIGGPANRQKVEEQLEALYLMPQLDGVTQDENARFREARHRQSFEAVHGGSIAVLKPINGTTGDAQADSSPFHGDAELPADLALKLNDYNVLRRAYDQALVQRQALREQLYSDWYKYMVAAYPPEDSHDDFPDNDEIGYFIQTQSMPELDQVNNIIGSQETVGTNSDSLMAQLQAAGNELARAVDQLQLLTVDDIRAWPRFIEILNGRKVPTVAEFRPFFTHLLSMLGNLRPTLGAYSEPVTPISKEDQEKITAGLNIIISTQVDDLISDQFMGLLPAEGGMLLQKKEEEGGLAPADSARLGRIMLQTVLPEVLVRRSKYTIEEVPAPRYWRPTEPVVLLADSKLEVTHRHGEDGRMREDGLLECFLVAHTEFNVDTTPTEDPFTDQLFEVEQAINTLAALYTAEPEGESDPRNHLGFYEWSGQPWHPFMLEWSVELFPIKEKGSHSALNRHYDPDFFGTHYEFPHSDAPTLKTQHNFLKEEVDLKSKKSLHDGLSQVANVYHGRSIMLDYAQPLLIDRLTSYCEKYIAPLYYEANDIPLDQRLNKPSLEGITKWAKQNRENLSKFNQAVLDIQIHFETQQNPPWVQSLSGFNAALLQHKQTLQLPIEDPIGFEDAKTLAAQINTSLGAGTLRAPQPLNDFNPLRTGGLRLLELRLVDTFGRYRTIPTDSIDSAAPFPKLDSHTVELPPRIVQPFRLNFDWLSANITPEHGDMLANSHPGTSPICGWFIPNYLDNSLMVYNQAGNLLGALHSKGQNVVWAAAHGRQHRILEADILNDYLYNLVDYFLKQSSSFLKDALTGFESALENILPANSSEHNSLALLVGRPLAVVRAELDLELLGQPATNQDWNLFRRTLANGQRSSDGFTGVQIPLRVGEHSRLNDGLLGFWIENDSEGENGYLDNKLYLPQTPNSDRTSSIEHPDIVRHKEDQVPHIWQAIDTPKRKLTMLIDPRAAVHISSGVHPVVTLQLQPEQYVGILDSLEMTFFTGPFITKQSAVELPVPTAPGYTWSLISKENGAWSETTDISPVESNATFSESHMIREGWLKLKKAHLDDNNLEG